ncbi:hypothetical protein BDN72DRAFT_129299 [Pluteus cervinus]|uniref:Uncharacterized protein n=1 Tax=Pluteus cervinus TaxID=181527 RepID=A0ACD3AMG2_9AGAR|nr:hypothetical protein BDN72DRAFT_129299 [Pluteus cervinus]
MNTNGQGRIDASHSVFNNTINHYLPPTRITINGQDRDEELPFMLTLPYLSQHAVRRAYFNAAERGNPPKCHPETRQEIISSFIAWPNDTTARSVRWISGWAGTGKTTIAQTLAEIWARQGCLAATFFFSRSSEETSTTMWLPATIAYQLSNIWPFHEQAAALQIQLSDAYYAWDYFVVAPLRSAPISGAPIVIIIDGLDECHNHNDQMGLLTNILGSMGRLGPSIKILITSRPERHLEGVFEEFGLVDSPNRIHLGQSNQDNDDIRTFLQLSFYRICKGRRADNAISITDGSWPSVQQIDKLVDRASGQFIYAATVVAFVDNDNEDPVEMLNLVLGDQLPAFEPIDALYIVILQKVAASLSPNLLPLMHNLLLHVNSEPSSSADIARFWFTKEWRINVLVMHLRAVLCRQSAAQGPIEFRHKSFRDFLARPSSPHEFSLAAINPISKFFYRLRMLTKKTSRSMELWRLAGFQWLGYSFLYCSGHPPVLFPYEEEAARLHRGYARSGPPRLRSCTCFNLEELGDLKDLGVIKSLGPCGQNDCIIDGDLLALCQSIEEATKRPADLFIQEWQEQESRKPTFFKILKCALALRSILFGLFDPLFALQEIIYTLIFRYSTMSPRARCVSLFNIALCLTIFLNARWRVLFLHYASHAIVHLFLRFFLRFDLTESNSSPV